MPRAALAADPAWRDLPVRGFVPVESVTRGAPVAATEPAPLSVPLVAVETAEGWEGRVSLFGDLER